MTVPPRKDLGSVPPPRSSDHATSGPRRAVAVWMLGAALICQLFLVLVGSIAIGLGGASGRRLRLFVLIGLGGLGVLLLLEVAILDGRVQARFAWAALAVLLLDVVFVLLLASGALAGRCSEAELAIINEIPSYGGLGGAFELESSTGACAAQLEVEASADEVLSYYERALREDGWTVVVQEIPTEAPEGEPVDVRELTATREGALFTIALESYSGRHERRDPRGGVAPQTLDLRMPRLHAVWRIIGVNAGRPESTGRIPRTSTTGRPNA